MFYKTKLAFKGLDEPKTKSAFKGLDEPKTPKEIIIVLKLQKNFYKIKSSPGISQRSHKI